MKIAMTGASGFIGRHVLTELLKQEVEIVAITRGAFPAELSRVVRTIEVDISHPAPSCFEKIGCPEILLHLAWGGLPNYKSLHHFETELPGQYHFLKILVESGLPSLLVTGTCFEYGKQSGSLSEEMLAQPNNPYGYAKNALRLQLEFLKLANPFSLTWARLFYMYGQGQSNASLFTKLKEAVVRGDKVFNMSGGEQLRDYLPVGEIAGQIVRLAMLKRDIGVINICSGEPVSIRKLVERWLHENNWKIELNLGHYPYPDYEPMAFWGDSSRIDSINAQE
ncbi:MAG: NAD(P)-dependent oxidoreductase [Betaproteobacteria bacterium]|nr:MAG: NAD(P)-dependent oxidoreductase [Betaproteobacteria bacterium]